MKPFLAWSGRIVLGGSFAVAAALKVQDPATFAADIDHFRLLPYPLTLGLALYLPWLELFCGAAVLVRRHERGALLVLAGLCAGFALALASAWLRGLDISCGCFGHSAIGSSLLPALVRAVVLGLIAVVLYRLRLPLAAN